MVAAYDQAKALFDKFKIAVEAEPCDTKTCDGLLGQLKLLVFSGLKSSSPATGSAPEAAKEQVLARETLECACFLSIKKRDLQGFERHVCQLKMYLNNNEQKDVKQSEQKLPILGLYLLHLLSSDRIGEFHTELELINVDEYNSVHIRQPIELERYLMEGNYAKVLEAQKSMPAAYCSFFLERLLETVRLKVGASLERSYESLPANEAARMLHVADVAALQEFAFKENERKAREESDDPMGDMTPSLTRRARVGVVRWEVKDGRLHFKRIEAKRMEIPSLDLISNAIGYATDLERIV